MKTNDKTRLQSTLSRRYMGRFLLSAFIFTLTLIIAGIIAYLLIQLRVWYPEEPGYQFLSFVRNNIEVFFFGSWIVCAIVILLVQWRQIARGVILLSEGVRQVAMNEDVTVELPREMRELQLLLQQVQLESRQNRQLAVDAEQRKNDLVVYLAHDLKTPLTSVLGYLTLLRDEQDIRPELREKYLGVATSKAQKLEDLINEFFEITRFSLKGLMLEPSRFSFSRMTEQITDEFRPLLSGKELTYELDIRPGIDIVADATKLERVLDNLLRNAVAYSYPDSAIQVKAWAEGNWVYLVVQNNGATIPPHKLAHLFEQFYRVDDSRNAEEGGSGLGLAIAKEIVELHGGGIWAKSEEETIELSVTLPAAPAVKTAPMG